MRKYYATHDDIVYLQGCDISFSWKPLDPIIANPIAVAVEISWNSLLSVLDIFEPATLSPSHTVDTAQQLRHPFHDYLQDGDSRLTLVEYQLC